MTDVKQPIRLHIGCSDQRLAGYINVDCRKTHATDVVALAWDIPGVAPGSVTSIYSRHMLEHLDPEDARKALRHWLDLLQPTGILHIIVPDVEFHAKQLLGLVHSSLGDQTQHAFAGFWGWRDMMRGGTCEDAHRWGYTQSTLSAELSNAGFTSIQRLTQGKDTEPWHLNFFSGKAKTENAKVTFKVTLAVPAYKAEFLDSALRSAYKQDGVDFEILICDDCRTNAVADVVRSFLAGQNGVPIRYFHNEAQLGEADNCVKCLELARGEYVKFLYDDDLLLPGILAAQADVLDAHPEISLVTSRRRVIDELGHPVADSIATLGLFDTDVCVMGHDLVSFLAQYTLNFIGEPTCVMARREQLLSCGPDLMSLAGIPIHWVGDLTLHVKLLRLGNLAILNKPGACFRVSPAQFSHQGRLAPGIGDEGHLNFKKQLSKLGWTRPTDNQWVRVAPLAEPSHFEPVDLAARLAVVLQTIKSRQGLESSLLLTQSDKLDELHPLFSRYSHFRNASIVTIAISSNGNACELQKTQESVQAQIHPASTMVVISPESPMQNVPHVGALSWTLLLCEGDVLESDGLLLLERAIERNGTEDTLLVYFDHDEINEQGQFDCPHLKPDFNHDLLLSYPYIGRAVLVRTAWLAHCLSSAEAPQASLPLAYWLALRAVAEAGAPAFLHLPAVIAHMAAAEPAVFASTTECWQQLADILAVHLAKAAPGAQIAEGPGPGTFKVVYPLDQAPLVTIVIPTRDQVALLSRCIVSIFQNTNYPRYEIIVVDNDSQTMEAQEFLAGLSRIESGQVRVLRAPGKFNFSRMNNLAAKEARGDFLLLLNNDTAATQPDWLSHLVRNALREKVGVVGARLLYPDDTLQHAGLILGLRGPADHPCIGIPADGAGYLYRAQVQQDFSAVTAACLLVHKSLYLALGGLDETSFAVSYNDVDFCLRVRQTGRRIVWTPLATLLHEGSDIQKTNVEGTSENNKLARFASERAAMYARWPEQIANDPAFNPNLSRRKLGYELEESNPLLRFDKLQGLTAHRVLALPCDADGCGQYRVLQPMQAMLEAGLCTGGSSREVFAPNLVLRSGADTLVVQRVDNDFGLDFLEAMRAVKGVKKIYEVDDHPSKVRLTNEAHKLLPKDMRGRVAKAIGLCDRLVVSTPPLARALASYNSDIRVVPNRLPPAMWGATPPQKRLIQEVAQRKPKVGWAGGIGHAADLVMIEAVIKEFSDRVDWVFIGVVPDSIRKYLKGYLSGVPTLKYPDLMMAQDWDLAIAPLELHEFNECKSNLKLLEYGWCGIPVVCSDITPYQCGLNVTRVKNRFKDWRNAIAERIADLEACHRDGLVLQQQIATDWTLQGEHVLDWYKAWTD